MNEWLSVNYLLTDFLIREPTLGGLSLRLLSVVIKVLESVN